VNTPGSSGEHDGVDSLRPSFALTKRLEARTFGLKGLIGAEELRVDHPDLILHRSFIARRVLELASHRDPETAAEMGRTMRALASIVLASAEVRLAAEVLKGGRFAAVKAVELAELLVVAKEAPIARQSFA
jgi:hypothetical protein